MNYYHPTAGAERESESVLNSYMNVCSYVCVYDFMLMIIVTWKTDGQCSVER